MEFYRQNPGQLPNPKILKSEVGPHLFSLAFALCTLPFALLT
jgi:hypothetical protein